MHILERVTTEISIQENILGMGEDDGWLYV